MRKKKLKFKKIKYPYLVIEDYYRRCPIPAGMTCSNGWFDLRESQVVVFKDYAWDGPSGMTFDTPNSMEGSLIHDVFYQAIQDGYILYKYRKISDRIFRDVLKDDGMSFIRRWYWFIGLRLFGGIFMWLKKKGWI